MLQDNLQVIEQRSSAQSLQAAVTNNCKSLGKRHQRPVHTLLIDVQLGMISMDLLTIFEIQEWPSLCHIAVPAKANRQGITIISASHMAKDRLIPFW